MEIDLLPILTGSKLEKPFLEHETRRTRLGSIASWLTFFKDSLKTIARNP